MEWIRVSDDRTHFVYASSNERVEMWGFNYDRDDAGRLIEDYWVDQWHTVAEDFGEMKALGANVVRVHLQLARFMRSSTEPDEANLGRLAKLLALAEDVGLYLDITGLGCYHRHDVPAWYDALDESARWDVQARFWQAVARACRDSPAVFCYDLMNEPVVGGTVDEGGWLPGKPLGGKYFVQRLTLDRRGRSDKEIARAWVERLTSAIREVDRRHLVTVGAIPWAQTFNSPEVGAPLDFVSVHFYPNEATLEENLAVLKVYDVGKPLVVEEIFPLRADAAKTAEFITRSRTHVDGYVGFYWGASVAENRKKGTLQGAIVADWLERFSAMSPYCRRATPRHGF